MSDDPTDTPPPASEGDAAPVGRDTRREHRRGRRRMVLIGLGAFCAVAAGVVVLPAHTWVTQRLAIRRDTAQLEQLRASNRALAAKIDKLGADSSIERQAREQFGLVYPGEEPYTVLASPPPSVNLPRAWPFDVLQDPLARAAARQPPEGAGVSAN